MHPGGIADKVGNRYEARWLIYQLFGLLDGSAVAFTVEKIGPEEEGFEFEIQRPDGLEWHQCKRQTRKSWTIRRLESEGVLKNFAARLKTDADGRCVFVSTDPATQLKRLKEKEASSPNAQSFESSLSVDDTGDWTALRSALGMSASEAFTWLQRCQFKTFPEDELEEVIRAKADRWFTGSPDAAYDHLRSWVEQDATLNRRLTFEDLCRALSDMGLGLKQYELDKTLPGRLAAATRHYMDTYRPIGAGLFEIERDEVCQLTERLLDEDGPKIIALSGPAGSGKSVIVRKALEALQAAGKAHLAFRVDQLEALNSLANLGEAVFETAESPAIVVEQLAGSGVGVLVIDQADAVSEMAGRSGGIRRLILKLVEQARHYPHVRVIFSCRSFDLENDHQFQEILKRPDTIRIDVQKLKWDEQVEPVLSALGIEVDRKNARTREILSNPIGLTLAAELGRTGPADLRRVEHLSQLYDALLEAREREVRKLGASWSLLTCLQAIADSMSERQELIAPVMVLDAFPGAQDYLQHVGLIVVRDRRASLLHESLFDYLHARSFVARGEKLEVFLFSTEQTLFRRTQVRQILALEREGIVARYLQDLGMILSDSRVRPHVRDLVIRWLATLPDPRPAEWQIVANWAAQTAGLPRQTGRVIYDRPAWFRLLNERGVLQGWFKDSSDDDLIWVLGFLRTVADREAKDVAILLDTLLDRRPDTAKLMLRQFWYFDPKRPAPELAESLARALNAFDLEALSSLPGSPATIGAGWAKHAPADASLLTAATLRNWFRLHPTGTPFDEDLSYGTEGLHHLDEFSKESPMWMLKCVLPAMHEAMSRTAIPDECPAEDKIWYWRHQDKTDVKVAELIDLVRAALNAAAAQSPTEVAELLIGLQPDKFMTALHLLFETVPSNPKELANLLAGQIDNPGLFLAGWHGARGYSAGRAFGAAWPHLTPEIRQAFEQKLLHLWPEHAFALKCYQESLSPVEGQSSPERLREIAQYYMEAAGETLWSTAQFLDRHELSPKLRSQLDVLDRKFSGKSPQEPDGIRGGAVRSPIAPDRGALMNDNAWLTAMTKFSSRPRDRWRGDGLIGGARELSYLLGPLSKADPERFLQLLSRIPAGVDDCFPEAIIRGFSEGKPQADFVDRVIEVLAQNPAARPGDRSVAWLIQSCPEDPGPLAMATLTSMAAKDENETGVGDIREENERDDGKFKKALRLGSHLSSQAINSARGSALEQLGNLSWHSKDQFDAHKELAGEVAASQVPPYVHAALNPFVLAALKWDQERAFFWLTEIANRNPTSLFASGGRRALQWADQADHERAKPIIGSLLSLGEVGALFAAWIVFVRGLVDERWDAKVTELLQMGPEFRATAASVAATFISDPAVAEQCIERLLVSFQDDDEQVRSEASDVFRQINPSELGRYARLYEAFVHSPQFDIQRGFFLHRLEGAPAELDSLVLTLVERAIARCQEADSRDHYRAYELWDPIFRIYTSNEVDADIRRRCLDAIDALLEMGALGADKLNAA